MSKEQQDQSLLLTDLLKGAGFLEHVRPEQSVGNLTAKFLVYTDENPLLRLSRTGYLFDCTHVWPTSDGLQAHVDTLLTVLAVKDQFRNHTNLFLHNDDSAAAWELIVARDIHAIPVSQKELAEWRASPTPIRSFCRAVALRAPPKDLSDYDPTSYAHPRVFRGRKAELNRVLGHELRCFAITGARKIGKTSFGRAIQRAIAANGGTALFVNCYAMTSVSDMLDGLREAAKAAAVSDRELREARDKEDYTSFLRVLCQIAAVAPLHIIIDEVDPLIESDPGNYCAFLRAVRVAQERHVCRIIFIGWKRLSRDAVGVNNPLHGRLHSIELKNLNQGEARELIIGPPGQYGVTFHDENKIVTAILARTSGHPFYITLVCSRFLEGVDRRTRVLRYSDLHDVVDADVIAFIQKTIRANTSALEELIANVAVGTREDIPEGTLREHVCHLIGPLDQKIWDQCVEQLLMCDILVRVNNNLSITVPLLREALAPGRDGRLLALKDTVLRDVSRQDELWSAQEEED